MKQRLLKLFFTSALVLVVGHLKAQTVAQVSTFAGNNLAQSSDATIATQAGIKSPIYSCFDANNNLYVLEISGNIWKITPSGNVTTIYYENDPNFMNFFEFGHILVDNSSNVYFTRGFSIAKVTSPTSFQTIAGNLNESGDLNNDQAGQGKNARFHKISGMCSDLFGNLYISEIYLTANFSFNSNIKRIIPSTQTTQTLYRSEGAIHGLCFDNTANFIFGENNAVIKLNAITNTKTLVAGNPDQSGHINGTGPQARFEGIVDVKYNSTGNEIIVLEGYNLKKYFFLVFDAFTIPFTNSNSVKKYDNFVRRINATNGVSDLAGGISGYTNAIGMNAKFRDAKSVSLNSSGSMFLADAYNNVIRKIDFVVPAPPVVSYINAPANICLGSTVYQPGTTTGSETTIQIKNDSIDVPNGIKAVGRSHNFAYVVTNNSQIRKYDFLGNYISTFSPPLTNITRIVADSSNRLYVVAQDNTLPALTSVYRIQSDGNMDFSWGSTGSGVLNNVSDMAFAPNGMIYVADTTTGYISTIDTLDATVTNLPPPSNFQLSYTKPVSLSFDLYGDLYLVDKAQKQVLKRNKDDNNYYSIFPGIENEDLELDGITIDKDISGNIILTSSIQNKVYELSSTSILDTTATGAGFIDDYEVSSIVSVNSPKDVITINTNFVAGYIVPCLGTNKLKVAAMYSMKISPRLPRGLFYDQKSATIQGTPLETAPYTTYTITTYGGATDSTQTTISFSVDPSSLVSNTIGNKTSPIINTADGLSVNFYSDNGCEPLAKITDNVDGNATGSVQVKQTVSNTLPFFTTSSGNTQFIRRSTEVNAQKMDSANVRIELYFTHADIVHYNANNGTQTDFSNDTTSGSMTMSVLQLHTSANGSTQPITHNTTATWNTAKQVWVANFQVTKFSTFYATTPDALTTFECASTETIEFAFGCSSAEFNGVTYTTEGEYTLNYINQYGCDSIINLTVFLDNNVSINMVAYDTLKVSNTASGTTYQWVNCDNNYAIIPGATDSLFFAADSGNYACIISNVICTDTSVCAWIQNPGATTGIDAYGEIYSYSISPNPSNGLFVVNSNFSNLTVEVYNLRGEKISSSFTSNGNGVIDLTSYSSGVYLVKFITESGFIRSERIVKY